MRRRQLIALLGGTAAWPLVARAQQVGKVWRIGYLAVTNPATKPDNTRIWNEFIKGLREHGYVEGQNLVIEYRFSEGRSERWPELASELVRLKVDLILVGTTPAALAAKNASSSIPIVHAGAIDPVAEVRPDGLLVLGDELIYLKRELVADLMLQKRLVAVTPYREMTKLGALMSYGVDFAGILDSECLAREYEALSGHPPVRVWQAPAGATRSRSW